LHTDIHYLTNYLEVHYKPLFKISQIYKTLFPPVVILWVLHHCTAVCKEMWKCTYNQGHCS